MISPVKIWRNQKKIREVLGEEGSILSYSLIRVPPAGFEDQAPYFVVLVKLPNRKYVGQLVDCKAEEVQIGKKVKAILRRVRRPSEEGIIPYGIKFRIIE